MTNRHRVDRALPERTKLMFYFPMPSEGDSYYTVELPFFENEWVAPKELKFDLGDINKVLLITSRDFQEPAFEDVDRMLKSKDIEYCFLSEKWLPDNILPDTTRYFFRIENWRKFMK